LRSGRPVADRGDHHNVGIRWIDDDVADDMRVAKADAGPRPAGIYGLVDAITRRLLAGSDINNVGIRFGDGDGAYRRDAHLIDDWPPALPGLHGLPATATGRADVIRIRTPIDGARRHTTAPERADQPPLQRPEQSGVDRIPLPGRWLTLLRRHDRGREQHQNGACRWTRAKKERSHGGRS